jgi:hypothetical protein
MASQAEREPELDDAAVEVLSSDKTPFTANWESPTMPASWDAELCHVGWYNAMLVYSYAAKTLWKKHIKYDQPDIKFHMNKGHQCHSKLLNIKGDLLSFENVEVTTAAHNVTHTYFEEQILNSCPNGTATEFRQLAMFAMCNRMQSVNGGVATGSAHHLRYMCGI